VVNGGEMMHVPKVAPRARVRRLNPRAHLFAACFGLVFQPVTVYAKTPGKRVKVPSSVDTTSQGGDSLPTLEPLKSPETGPMAELKKSNTALKRLFQRQSPSWSPENEVRRSEMHKIASGILDFDEIARRSLAHHWDDLSSRQRYEFVVLLRDLIERNYIKRAVGHPNYDLRFEREDVSGREAIVGSTLGGEHNGRRINVKLEYRLLYNGGRWWVLDVVTDEQSMLENWQTEFNEIITRESFESLLKHMKKRLEKDEKESVLHQTSIRHRLAVEVDRRLRPNRARA
jgi:phospholipid transport system substrate-binding protein